MKWSELKCSKCDRGYFDQICINRKIKIWTVWKDDDPRTGHECLVQEKISEVKKDFRKYGFFGKHPKFQYQIKADCLQCAINIWNRIRKFNAEKRECVGFFCQ